MLLPLSEGLENEPEIYHCHYRFNHFSYLVSSRIDLTVLKTYEDFLKFLESEVSFYFAKQQPVDYNLFQALYSSIYNREEQGLELLGKTEEFIKPDAYKDKTYAVFSRALLLMHDAINKLKLHNNIEAALQHYFDSLSLFIKLKSSIYTLKILFRINDIASKVWDESNIRIITIGLLKNAIDIELLCGNKTSGILQQISNNAVASARKMQNFQNLDLLFALSQIAKSHAFGFSLSFTSADILDTADYTEKIYKRIPELKLQEVEWKPLDEFKMLTNINVSARKYADDVNLSKKEFDELLTYSLKNYALRFSKTVPSFFPQHGFFTSDVQKCLDKKTILIYMDNVELLNNRFHVRSYIFSNDSGPVVLFAQTDFSQKKDNSFSVTLIVSKLREYVKSVPEKGWLWQKQKAVGTSANELLKDVFTLLWGDEIIEVLNNFYKQGKTDICIVPHGPLHYLPFHLLGGEDYLLCSRFRVSYLPSLHMLQTNRPKSFFDKTDSIFCVGVDFKYCDLLNTLDNVTQETTAIAKIFNCTPLLNEDVTKKKVMLGLQQYKYIHIASHGVIDVECPNFHRIYLHSTNHNLNCLFAYDILMIDMRGVDLVTLSVCETALGKFDLGDNLVGLPASLFLSGVTTIIATLWEVETYTSEFFFTTLYSEIKSGKNKFEAFCVAQKHTEEKFPRYCDWGAFYFMGQRTEESTRNDMYTTNATSGLKFSRSIKNI